MDAVHVVGAGGIGCAVGYALRAAGVPVVFVDANPAKVEAGRRDGVASTTARRCRPSSSTSTTGSRRPARPSCSARSATTTRRCWRAAGGRRTHPDPERLRPATRGARARGGGHRVVRVGVRARTARTRGSRGRGSCTWGKIVQPRRAAAAERRLARSCSGRGLRGRSRFRVVEVPRIEPIKHTKLMYNAAISPLAAAAGIDNGQAPLACPAARRCSSRSCRRTTASCRAAGVELGKVGPFHPRRSRGFCGGGGSRG